MGEKHLEKKQEVTKMFSDEGDMNSDQQLALDIIHRFNICRDTLETMPAFEEHRKSFFSVEKEK